MGSQKAGQDGQRVTCSRCQANNFVGQTHCWQCRAPLSAGAASMPSAASQPTLPPVRNRPGDLNPFSAPPPAPQPRQTPEALAIKTPPRPVMFAALFAVAVLAFGVVFLIAGHPQTAPALPPPVSESRSMIPDPSPVRSPEAQTETRSETADSDPILDEGKRALEREKRHLDLPSSDGVVSSDGRVHLRSGGSISPEEWREAQRKLKDSPVLRDLPSPPPF